MWGYIRGYIQVQWKEIPPMKLTARQISTAKPQDKPYKLADGGGLYLLVNPNGSRY